MVLGACVLLAVEFMIWIQFWYEQFQYGIEYRRFPYRMTRTLDSAPRSTSASAGSGWSSPRRIDAISIEATTYLAPTWVSVCFLSLRQSEGSTGSALI